MDKQIEKLSQDKVNAARGVKSPNIEQEDGVTQNDDSATKKSTTKERLDERARKAGC